MPSEDEALEELLSVTDSEEEKPVYTPQCINLERWQVLPTKPGRRCLGGAVFLLCAFLRFPQNRPTRGDRTEARTMREYFSGSDLIAHRDFRIVEPL